MARPEDVARLDANLQKAAGSARQLSFAVGGAGRGIEGAAGAAGNLAEQFALVTRNAKLAASAAGIGALVSIGITIAAAFKEAEQQMKDFNATMNRLGSDIAIAQLKGISPANDLLAKKEAILAASQQEFDLVSKIANEDERRAAQAQVMKKRREEINALEREAARQRDREFGDRRADLTDEIRLLEVAASAAAMGDTLHSRFIMGGQTARVRRDSALRDLQKNDAGLNDAQLRAQRELIEGRFRSEMRLLEADLATMAGQVGQTFVGALADGISHGIATAIRAGSLGEGFRALTGAILIGLGDMVQQIGVQSLLAANLMASIVKALRAFAPEGAIGPAIALIALGGVLKGLGASMGGSGGRSGAGSGGSGGGTRTITVGTVYPGGAPNTSGITAAQPITLNATFIGARDPKVQREMLELLKFASARGAV